MTRATSDEIAELLGDHVDESIVERIAAIGATFDEIGEAIDDLDYERRYGEPRESSSQHVEDVRSILEELPAETERQPAEPNEEEEHEGLRVIDPEELGAEPQ